MNKSFLILFGLGFLALIRPGDGRFRQYAGLDPSDRKDLDEMLENHSDEISMGYDKAPRKPDNEISDSPSDVHFYLYTDASDPEKQPFFEIPYNWYTVARQAPIIPNAPWKILIHGFTQNQNSSFPQLLVKEYLKRKRITGKGCNILVVDWGLLAYSVQAAHLPIYNKAVQNVAVAGKRVGQMIAFLKGLELNRGSGTEEVVTAIKDLSLVHIIGFSLGAHVAGVAGDYVSNKFSRKCGRITGLDPAGPHFYADISGVSGRQLRYKDAGAMDIIHTSWNAYGIGKEIGDADFYPNAGPASLNFQVQPWCIVNHFLPPLVCSHNLAPVFYALSINHPDSMDACQCGSWASYKTLCPCRNKALMGEYWKPSQVGRYYLDISSKALDGEMNHLKKHRY